MCRLSPLEISQVNFPAAVNSVAVEDVQNTGGMCGSDIVQVEGPGRLSIFAPGLSISALPKEDKSWQHLMVTCR